MKIGIIRFSALGDIAASLPVLRALKYKPVIITSPIGFELLKDEFEEFIILNKKNILDVVKLIIKIRQYNFDYLIDLQTNDRSKLICKASNAKNILNSKAVNKEQQVTKIFYDIAQQAKDNIINGLDTKYKQKEKKYIVINCGSSPKWISKRLPHQKWQEITEFLYNRYTLPFYLTGDASEVQYIQEVANYIQGEKVIIAGKTTIQELKSVLSNAYLTVSTDSAPMHISAVQGTPTIGIFGSTNWLRSAPFGPWSTVLYDETHYLNGITPMKNSKLIGNYYDNIKLKNGLDKISNYLGI
ncbi:MAG: glycosyltransferase family 9 protein [Sulfurospirillum sp.]|nr:glycosyltransferase family 9 protein [Sulfurospirillum sp.]